MAGKKVVTLAIDEGMEIESLTLKPASGQMAEQVTTLGDATIQGTSIATLQATLTPNGDSDAVADANIDL